MEWQRFTDRSSRPKARAGGESPRPRGSGTSDYIDADGIRRRVAGFTDKSATMQRAAELEQEARDLREGVTDRYRKHRKRPLLGDSGAWDKDEHGEYPADKDRGHVGDWHRALLDGGTTAEHAGLSARRVRAILKATEAAFWTDLDANRVAAYLADRRKDGLSVESSNHYLRRVKQFARWMVNSGRAAESPLACLKLLNAQADRRRNRRAFTADELRTLIDTASNGGELFGLTGPERAMVYRVAVETGLRAAELRSLKVSSFSLDADPPTVVVQASSSKHRRTDELPLRRELADQLRTFLACKLPDVAAFRVPQRTAAMIRADLAAAEIAYRDEAGRVGDFHALRHTFITNLVRGGANPKDAQQLARHSTIGLTMDRYTALTAVGSLRAALEVLPDLDADRPEKTQQRATGTHGGGFRDVTRSRSRAGAPRRQATGGALSHLLSHTGADQGRSVSASVGEGAACAQATDASGNTENKGVFGDSDPANAGSKLTEGAGTRTQDPRLKRPLLYRLSYTLAVAAYSSSVSLTLASACTYVRTCRASACRRLTRFAAEGGTVLQVFALQLLGILLGVASGVRLGKVVTSPRGRLALGRFDLGQLLDCSGRVG